MASRVFIPASVATTVKLRTAVNGWILPHRPRGSGMVARISTKDSFGIGHLRQVQYRISPSSPTPHRKRPWVVRNEMNQVYDGQVCCVSYFVSQAGSGRRGGRVS